MLLAFPPARADQVPDLAALKSATLELMQAQAQPADGPGTLSLFAGNRDPALLLDELRVSLDHAPPQRYEYSDVEAQALHQDGLHRFLLTSLQPGTHHLRADFAARYAEAPPDHARAAGTLEQDFKVDAQPAWLELELVKGNYLGKPELQFHALKAAPEGGPGEEVFDRGGAADPRLRYSVFLSASERPLAALAELYALRREAGGATPAWQQRHSQAMAAFGLGHQSDSTVQDDPLAQAYAGYNQGVALLRQGRAAEGAALLETVAAGKAAGEEAAALRDQADLVLGYAQLRNHTGANAVQLFSRVRSPGPSSNAALLGLGWALLAPSGNGQNATLATAAPEQAFRRIPVLLQPQLTGDIAALKQGEPYQLRPAAPEEEQALRRALVPWTELIGRDPLDPAVQEGMIAIPYALNHMGSYDEAREYFQRALRLLDAANGQLDLAMQRVRDGTLVQVLDRFESADRGWSWWLAAYPREHWWLADDPRQPMAAPDNFYLQRLMADDAFRAAMQDFHDLRLLDQASQRLDGAEALRRRLEAATAAQAALLRELALAELDRERRHTRMYLGEARFALARVNEPPLPPAADSPASRPGAHR
ncbi:MAG: hypothetical protein JOY51_02350 [Nevskia sp.]|nr:hypothetical protein [Nevskia sp.]